MDVDRLFLMQFGLEREDFAFAFPVEAVAAFGFDGGRAVGAEVAKIFQRTAFQVGRGGSAKFFYAVADAAARMRDFFIRGAGDAHFVFRGAALGKNEVGVGIDEAGENDASAEIQFFGAAGSRKLFDFFAGADGDDPVFVEDHGTVADDAEIFERFAAAGCGAAQG